MDFFGNGIHIQKTNEAAFGGSLVWDKVEPITGGS
jgi:hypothetical protein